MLDVGDSNMQKSYKISNEKKTETTRQMRPQQTRLHTCVCVCVLEGWEGHNKQITSPGGAASAAVVVHSNNNIHINFISVRLKGIPYILARMVLGNCEVEILKNIMILGFRW